MLYFTASRYGIRLPDKSIRCFLCLFCLMTFADHLGSFSLKMCQKVPHKTTTFITYRNFPNKSYHLIIHTPKKLSITLSILGDSVYTHIFRCNYFIVCDLLGKLRYLILKEFSYFILPHNFSDLPNQPNLKVSCLLIS